MKIREMISVATLSCALSVAASAGAATIAIQTSRPDVEAATGLSGGSLIDFEGLASGSFAAVTDAGVTFSSPNLLDVNGLFDGAYNQQGKSLKSVRSAAISFDFAAPVTGFGFFFGLSDNDWLLSAYDAEGALLESLVIPPTKFSNAGDFFGVIAPGIAHATLTSTGADYVAIDDFRTSNAPVVPQTAVPEPAAWALMILGFGAAGSALRARRKLTLA